MYARSEPGPLSNLLVSSISFFIPLPHSSAVSETDWEEVFLARYSSHKIPDFTNYPKVVLSYTLYYAISTKCQVF